ncbi:MAG TPA: MgtC/SapB family protein [Gemmatimonadales bacterium]|nr:MgtC/SapB family protein [Gemmatimonadales bacterium]
MNDSAAVVLERLLVALMIGILIGLDRERAEVRKARQIFAGVRTFPLVALAGAIPVLLVERVGPLLLAVSLLSIAAIAVVSYVRSSAGGDIGATTEVAAVATFLLGALAGAGELVVAGACGVAVAVLLVAKPKLEGFSRALTPEELTAALELAVITVIVLPLLPNRGYGPWHVLNPREIWLVVVLVTALSFVGFVAMRLLGERRGMQVTGAVGGLVSSTAVTMAMAERSRAEESLARPAAAAALVASSIMPIRIAVLAGAVNAGILPRLLPMVAAMTLAGLVAAWVLSRRRPDETAPSGAKIRNPFSVVAALSFAAIYGVVLMVVRGAGEWFGAGGTYAAAGLSAVADVDAVTIAFSRLGPGATLWQMPAAAVAVAAVVNTIVKLGIGVTMGGGRFRRYVAVSLGAEAAAGAVAGIAVYMAM